MLKLGIKLFTMMVDRDGRRLTEREPRKRGIHGYFFEASVSLTVISI